MTWVMIWRVGTKEGKGKMDVQSIELDSAFPVLDGFGLRDDVVVGF